MRRLSRWTLIVATVAAFAATFFHPTTRETQILMCRLLLHCPTENTELSASCPTQPVPYVRFSQEFRERLRADQGRSAKAYPLAHAAGPAISAFPPPDEWKSNPLARWAVLHEAGRISLLHSAAGVSTQAAVASLASEQAIENTLATIRMLQIRQPQEGGLWLAEAVVLFSLGEDESGLQSVWSAINRDQWTTTRDEFFEPAKLLLESSGLPRLEASQIAGWNGRVDPHAGVLMNAGEALVAMMAKAVRCGEDQKVDQLLMTFAALGRVGRESIEFGLDIEAPGSFNELVSAMAERMGRPPPPREMGSDYEAWQKARRQILTEYLDNWVAPEVAAFFGDEHAREKEAAECRVCRCPRPDWVKGMPLLPGLAGAGAILLLSLLVSALIAEVPFLVAPPLRLGSREVFPAGFLAVLMATFVVMIMVWFIALQAVGSPEGLTIKGRTFLPGEYLAVVVGAAFSFVVAGLRRQFVWHAGWCRAAWLGAFVLYLAVLWEAGESRIVETQRFAFPPW